DLLSALQTGRLLDSGHTAKLLELLQAARIGADELRAGLPREVVLAHKTGQISGIGGSTLEAHDVGIASGNGRRLAIAVLLTDVDAPVDRCHAVIAEVARTVWSEVGAAPAPDSGTPPAR